MNTLTIAQDKDNPSLSLVIISSPDDIEIFETATIKSTTILRHLLQYTPTADLLNEPPLLDLMRRIIAEDTDD